MGINLWELTIFVVLRAIRGGEGNEKLYLFETFSVLEYCIVVFIVRGKRFGEVKTSRPFTMHMVIYAH